MFDDDFDDDDFAARFREMKAQMSAPATVVAQVLDEVATDDEAFDEQFRQLKAYMKPEPALVAKVLEAVAAGSPMAEPRGAGSQPWGPPTGEPVKYGPPVWVASPAPQTTPAQPPQPQWSSPLTTPSMPPPPTGKPGQPPRQGGPAGRKRSYTGPLVGAGAAVVVAVVLMVSGLLPGIGPSGQSSSSPSPTGYWPAAANVSADYSQIYQTLSTTQPQPVPTDPPPNDQAQNTATTYYARDYENAVTGVDDTNVVVNDGHFMYIASGLTVFIVSVEGGTSSVVGRIDASTLTTYGETLMGPAVNLMLDGHTLVVLVQGCTERRGWSLNLYSKGGIEATTAKAAFYDVSDPAHPVLLGKVEQSGAYQAARIDDGIFYLVSSYTLDPKTVHPEDPATFVPVFDDGNGRSPIPADRIAANASTDHPVYTVVGAVDLATRTFTDKQVVLGWSSGNVKNMSNVYMSQSGIYLANRRDSGAGDVTVPGFDTYDGTRTDLVRITLDHGHLSVAGEATLPGQLTTINAIDEDGGHVRLATSGQDTTGRPVTGLLVLDGSLTLVAAIPDLPYDNVKDVRFSGPVAYVTNEGGTSVAIDVSSLASPQVYTGPPMPAFPASAYLHPFGDGLLLGVVRTGDGLGFGSDEGLELSMFNVSDQYEVAQLAVLRTGQDDSHLVGDPKSVFVDPQRGLVGFPTLTLDPDNPSYQTIRWDYHVYHWTGAGFELAFTAPLLTGEPTSDKEYDAVDNGFTRAVVVGDSLCVASGASVWVFDLNGFARQGQVTLV